MERWQWGAYALNDGVHHASGDVITTGQNNTLWNTYKIRWYTDRVEWYLNDALVKTNTSAIPTSPMSIRANLWAPTASWTKAYAAALQPVGNAVNNTQYRYDIDYIKVARILPDIATVSGASLCGSGVSLSAGTAVNAQCGKVSLLFDNVSSLGMVDAVLNAPSGKPTGYQAGSPETFFDITFKWRF